MSKGHKYSITNKTFVYIYINIYIYIYIVEIYILKYFNKQYFIYYICVIRDAVCGLYKYE